VTCTSRGSGAGIGTVTSGQFAGADVTIIWVYIVPNPLQCATSGGITTQTGTIALQITGL
jgi:hypothetical protein